MTGGLQLHAAAPTLVIVPGLRDYVPDHWQTLLADQTPGAVTVPRLAGDRLSCAAWVAEIDRTLATFAGPVILVAHSAGVIMVVHWARLHRRPIHGALLATPADIETPLPPGYPTLQALDEGGWLPVPRERLPFPSIVAASSNDPLARYERIAGYAASWGGRLVNLGEVGHLNPAAGYGEWPKARELLHDLRWGP